MHRPEHVKIATELDTSVFHLKSIIYVMVERLQRQAGRFITKALELLHDASDMSAMKGDYLAESRRSQSLEKPIGFQYATSSLDEARSSRSKNRDKKGKTLKQRQKQ